RWLPVLVLVVGFGFPGVAAQPPVKNDPPQPLPTEVVRAWKDAGAEVGWMGVHRTRGPLIHAYATPTDSVIIDEFHSGFPGHLQFSSERDARPGDLPAFRFMTWKEGRLGKLPLPMLPFGLDLGDIGLLKRERMTDAGLKELVGMKGL